MGVNHNEQAPLRVVEHLFMDSGVPFTVLRPNFFWRTSRTQQAYRKRRDLSSASTSAPSYCVIRPSALSASDLRQTRPACAPCRA